MILLDTCALVDLVSPHSTLSQNTLDLIGQGATLLSVSIAEIACKVQAGKLTLHIAIPELIDRLHAADIIIQDISIKLWLDALALEWQTHGKAHRDPADRLILSYAVAHHLPLVTSDLLMQARYPRCIW